jgi:hypothetical protein
MISSNRNNGPLEKEGKRVREKGQTKKEKDEQR